MAYALPHLYDIAFGWRDVAAECDFLLGRFHATHGRRPERAIEIACGPGRHARTLAARGIPTVGLDLSPTMIAYAKVQPGGDDRDVTWQVGDMRDFALTSPAEMAFCLVDSLSHLLTLDDLLTHLDAVAHALVAGGLYIIEQSHPRDTFGDEPGWPAEWSAEDESGETTVHVTWGESDDPFDPIRQVGMLTVTLRAEHEGELVATDQSIVPSRLWLAGEMEAAIRLSGQWTIRERFGALDEAILWQNELPAWRMVTVLQRH